MSKHPYMRWGVFAIQATKANDELLPFVGQLFLKTEFKGMCKANPWFINYVLELKKIVHEDEDVLNGDIA